MLHCLSFGEASPTVKVMLSYNQIPLLDLAVAKECLQNVTVCQPRSNPFFKLEMEKLVVCSSMREWHR